MRTFVLFAFLAVGASATKVSPIEKVISLITGLQGKVTAEGEAQQAEFEEFQDWCKDESKNKGFEIKTGKGQEEDNTASVEKASSDIEELDTRIEELSASVATSEKDLAGATKIRKSEEADFEAADKEMMETVDTLDRAVGVLEKELRGGSSFIQVQNSGNVVNALMAVIAASSPDDASRVQSFLQADCVFVRPNWD